MEQLLYILLGACLALLGGIIQKHYQNQIDQIKEDKDILFKVETLLDSYNYRFLNKNVNGEDRLKVLEFKLGKAEAEQELFIMALKIQSKLFMYLAVRIIRFANVEAFRTEGTYNKLSADIYNAINPFVLRKYDSDMEGQRTQIRKKLKRHFKIKNDKELDQLLDSWEKSAQAKKAEKGPDKIQT